MTKDELYFEREPTGDDIIFTVIDEGLMVEINNPFAGDDEKLGESGHYTLTQYEINQLIKFLTEIKE